MINVNGGNTAFDLTRLDVISYVDYVLTEAPVKNLTRAEAEVTLRMIALHSLLSRQDSRYISLVRHDRRLENCTDEDKFLALLVVQDTYERILNSKLCVHYFGGTRYHWRKIGHDSPVTAVASAISEEGMGYYGRGWIIAPHIVTLRRWIVEHATDEEIRKLKTRL